MKDIKLAYYYEIPEAGDAKKFNGDVNLEDFIKNILEDRYETSEWTGYSTIFAQEMKANGVIINGQKIVKALFDNGMRIELRELQYTPLNRFTPVIDVFNKDWFDVINEKLI